MVYIYLLHGVISLPDARRHMIIYFSALLPTVIACVGLWYKRRQKRRALADNKQDEQMLTAALVKEDQQELTTQQQESDDSIRHRDIPDVKPVQNTDPHTAVHIGSALPSVLHVTPLVQYTKPATAIPVPIGSASPSVLRVQCTQPATAIPVPIGSASPSVLRVQCNRPATAIPVPTGSASPSVLCATPLGNDCTCKKPGPSKVKFVQNLGQGNQAFIHKVQLGNSILAAKISFPDTPVKDILIEFEILRHLSHKNIIAVNQALPQGFIMELCQTDLFSIIKTHGSLPPGVIHEKGSDIINGVSYLHSKGIAHLDIKPRNILLTKYAVAKIADFGLSLPIQNDDGSIRTLEHEFRGSFYYAPPDMFIQSCPIELASCDSWSMGATLFFIMTGNIPFEGETELELVQNQISENFNIPESLTNTINYDPFYNLFLKLIKSLCTRDTRNRFSIDKAKDFYGKLKL